MSSQAFTIQLFSIAVDTESDHVHLNLQEEELLTRKSFMLNFGGN